MLDRQSGICFVNMRGEIEYMDETFARLLEVDASRVLGSRLTLVFPETRLGEVLVEKKRLLSRHQLPGGRVIEAEYLPLIERNLVIIILRDVTANITGEYRQSTRELLENIFKAVLHELPAGILAVDRKGRVVFCNRMASNLLDKDEAEINAEKIERVVPFSNFKAMLTEDTEAPRKICNFKGKKLAVSETLLRVRGKVIGGVIKLLPRNEDSKELLDKFQLLEQRMLFYKEELAQLLDTKPPFSEIIGESTEIQQLKRLSQKVSRGDATVLIQGESGTGKEVFARAIHNASPRRGEPFVKINCAAIPENLLESELFGYEAGAFTGALKKGKPGKFELADGGTIFLDEIGDMPVKMQAKLLRVLQEKAVERIGGTKSIQVDVRVIAATNRNLEKLIEENKFRSDLYYRLAVITLYIPPLRERQDDILPLIQHIIDKLNIKYGMAVEGVSGELKDLLTGYSWPGNVRELENILEYAFNLADDNTRILQNDHLPPHFVNKKEANLSSSPTLKDTVAEAEKRAIQEALKAAGGNKQKAAELLGVHRSGLYQKLKKYGLEE